MVFESVMDGLIKAEIFSFMAMVIFCINGLNTRGRPHEIGHSLTRTVVASMITILILDYFVTKITL